MNAMTIDPTETSPFAHLFLPESLSPPGLPLDFAASTPVFAESIAQMVQHSSVYFGNPAARLHPLGDAAAYHLNQARQVVAQHLGVAFDEVIFTASATESNNLLLRGLVLDPLRKRKKILYGATEHASIAATAQALEHHFGSSLGIIAVPLPVNEFGQIDLNHAEREIDSSTLVVCAMDVNNETGLYQGNLGSLFDLCQKNGCPLHIDAAQGFVRRDFSARTTGFHTATISAAKLYGPRGAAALVVRKTSPKVRLAPQLTGGGHEAGFRSSTPNMAALSGFAKAVELYVPLRPQAVTYTARLEDIFWCTLKAAVPDVWAYGKDSGHKVPGILMLCANAVNAMKLVEVSKDLCVSVGSACRTLQATASHVLLAMDVPLDAALASLRVSFGLTNTPWQAHRAAMVLAEAIGTLRHRA